MITHWAVIVGETISKIWIFDQFFNFLRLKSKITIKFE